jgi:poly(3-hydroxybutyrate) depolymerase
MTKIRRRNLDARTPTRAGLCLLSILCSLALAAGASSAQTKQGALLTKESVTSGGRKRTYRLFVPAGLTAGRRAPLVVLLHPSGGGGAFLVERWRALAEREGLILAGPESSDPSKWSAPADGPGFLHDVAEAVRAKHPVDARRIYLFGYSAGSGFAVNMALLESEYFAAAAAFASVTFKEQYAEAAARKVPLFGAAGVEDKVFPIAEARAARDALRKRGFAVEWRELPEGHEYATRADAINAAAWEFLKQHSLQEDPRYTDYQFRR